MRLPLNWRKSGLLFLVLFISGCTMVGPDFKRPEATLSDSWATVPDESVSTASLQHKDWWTTFEDPVLNDLVKKAYEQNLDLQIAGLRILESRAQLGIATGNLYPQQQSLGAGIGAFGASDNAANTVAGDLNYNERSVGIDAGWELDLWGKFRRGVQSADARLLASIADYDSFLVTLTGEVARAYLLIRTADERIKFAQENVVTQKRSLEIVTARFEGGLVTELDLQQARNLLATTLAIIPAFETERQRAKNSLGILLGLPSQQVNELLSGPGVIPSAPPAIAVGIPAELLRRRPDVRQAELQAKAQSSLIGVAKADLFPHFSLLGSVGLRASDSSLTRNGGSDLSDLFDGDSVEFFGGPVVSWDIFNYGRIKNQVRVQDARLQQLLINYQNTVLRAARDVEDALVGLTNDRQQLIYLQEATDSSDRSVEISMLQYREGLVDFQRVLDSQRRLAFDQDTLTITRGSLTLNMVGVYKALGGGWQIRQGQPFVPDETRQQMNERTDWGDLLEESPTATEEQSVSSGARTPDW